MKFDNPSRKFNEYFAINQLHNSENTVPKAEGGRHQFFIVCTCVFVYLFAYVFVYFYICLLMLLCV